MFKNKKELKFLNDILETLLSEESNLLSFEDLVTKLNLDKDTWTLNGYKATFVDVGIKDYELYPRLYLALDYLVGEKYIYQIGQKFKISYFGILKIKTNSFTQEYNNKLWGSPRERLVLFILLLSLLINFFGIFFC
ncbi:hypothetical protein [Psychroflexus salis]|uniref:Uncharacterized protein n=1 Tax=Psychroflexus salis TaxID=1526574 RepID=A0A917A2A8_9FLAO|nr:hypothetical protein [Psychroflexus salis]GGE22912.1 hypothetical protein GCM10010831_24770 [Psychroflexus salis]